jgi:hypothetical protein
MAFFQLIYQFYRFFVKGVFRIASHILKKQQNRTSDPGSRLRLGNLTIPNNYPLFNTTIDSNF